MKSANSCASLALQCEGRELDFRRFGAHVRPERSIDWLDLDHQERGDLNDR
jgi:hypothetical protein